MWTLRLVVADRPLHTLIDLKEKNPNIFTIYVQDPKYKNNNFDLVIAPEHDALKGKNVISMIGPPNRITKNLSKNGVTEIL